VRVRRAGYSFGRPLSFTVRRPLPASFVRTSLYPRMIRALRFARAFFGKKHVHDGLTIRGDEAFIRATVEALELLKSKAPDVYALVQMHIGNVVAGKSSGVLPRALRHLPTTMLTMGPSYSEGSTVEYAGALAHETYHCELYRRAQRGDPHRAVPANEYSGEQAESSCLRYQCDVLRRLGLSEAHIDRYESSLKSKWWEVPFDERHW
jgi:hypothetical protein